MNSRRLRHIITSHVPLAKFLLIEEKQKPRPKSQAFWNNPNAAPPIKLNGSPHIVALIEVLCDHLEETTEARPKRTEMLNALIAEGLQSVSNKPEFAGLNPRTSFPDEDEILRSLGFKDCQRQRKQSRNAN